MILFSPGGVPTMVPPSLKNDYLRRGYTKDRPWYEKQPAPDPTDHPTITFIEDTGEEDWIGNDELGPPRNKVKRVYDIDKLEHRPLTSLTEKQALVLNNWDINRLMDIKGVGEVTALRIRKHRPFKYTEELDNITMFGGWGKVLKEIEENLEV